MFDLHSHVPVQYRMPPRCILLIIEHLVQPIRTCGLTTDTPPRSSRELKVRARDISERVVPNAPLAARREGRTIVARSSQTFAYIVHFEGGCRRPY